jgi:protein required for attachment to host cells
MSKLSIPHLGMVFVGDGRKALFLRNEGDEKFPNLKVERVLTQDNPPTRDKAPTSPAAP